MLNDTTRCDHGHKSCFFFEQEGRDLPRRMPLSPFPI